MKSFYQYLKPQSEVPHLAVMWGADSVDPGETVFTIELVDGAELAELAVIKLLKTANLKDQALLDCLVGQEVTHLDLPGITADVQQGKSPFIRPAKFSGVDAERASKAVFNGGPMDLAEFAASMAIKDLLGSWKGALADGNSINQLVTDVDDVIAHLKAFKALCVEKPTELDHSDYLHEIVEAQQKIAQEQFDGYGFKWPIQSSEEWMLYADGGLTKRAIASNSEFTARIIFHCHFYPGTSLIEEVFCTDTDTGLLF